MCVEKETNALANYEAHIVAKFAALYVIGRRFANMFSIKATEACERVRQLHEPLVREMERIQTLALPEWLERAKQTRDALLKLHDSVIDTECDVEQLETRQRYNLKRGVSKDKLQVRLNECSPSCYFCQI